MSESSLTVRAPIDVQKVAGGVGNHLHTHIGIKFRNLTALNHHYDKPQVDSSDSMLLIKFILETISGHRVENLSD